MGIPDEDVARVRAATDIVALIGEHAALKRQGRRWVGLCPFHGEKTPSFSVNAEEGFYYCFGCQAKGDAITFIREIERLDFVDAVRRLADKSGITIHEDATSGRDGQRRKVLLDAMERATEWYHQRLLGADDAGGARDYLRSRGYEGEVVRRFRLGWAPDDWDLLCSSLGLSVETAVGAGLGFVNRRGRLQDAFRARVLFPICDPSGHPVALGGRILPGSPDPAKYKNSVESSLYAKRKTLYALNWAKQAIIESDEVVVCEGYTDVIGLFECGVERAVATCGTALADEHVTLLRGFASRVVLAFDSDQRGTDRGRSFLRMGASLRDQRGGGRPPCRLGSRIVGPQRPRRPPVGHCGRQAVPPVSPGADPRIGCAVHSGGTSQSCRRRLDRGGRSSRQSGSRSISDAGGRAVPTGPVATPRASRASSRRWDRGLRRLSRNRRQPRGAVIDDPSRDRDGVPGGSWVRDPDDGDDGVDRFDAGGDRPSGGTGGGRLTAGSTGSGRSTGEFRPGLEALRLAIHRPDDVGDRLEAALFSDDLQREVFRSLVSADDLHQAIDDSSPEVRALLVRLTVEEPRGDPDDVVRQLVRDAARRELHLVTAEARSSSSAAEEAVAASAWVQELDVPSASVAATTRLVAWLVVREQTGTAGRES